MLTMELIYHNKNKYQVNLCPLLYIFKNHLTVTNAQHFRQSRMFTVCSRRVCSPFVPGTPPHHLIYIYMFNFIYTSPPIFISPFFFLNFFCPVVIIQQMMPRVQPILKPRTSPFVKAYGGIASFFFGKIFYETL
jgi:hypothetical protein